MQIVKLTDPTALDRATQTIAAGGLVICPTETVYGAMVDATNPAAVTKLLTYKRRPAGKAISVAVTDQNMAEQYVALTPQARQIYATLLPGPVTVVSHSLGKVDPRLESEFKSLGIRLPDHDFLIKLIKKCSVPLTATSANSAGRKTPYRIADIWDNLSTKQQSQIDLIIDAGQLPRRPPSLVIDTTASAPIVMRPHRELRQFSASRKTDFTTVSVSQTQQLAGQILLPHLPQIWDTGLVITLDGSLGAGKTTFTKGLAQFLGINQTVNSPTYTYLKEYSFTKFYHRGQLDHLDAWTIDRPDLLATLGLETLFQPGHLVVIEWSQQLTSLLTLPSARLEIIITPQGETNTRQLTVIDHSLPESQP